MMTWTLLRKAELVSMAACLKYEAPGEVLALGETAALRHWRTWLETQVFPELLAAANVKLAKHAKSAKSAKAAKVQASAGKHAGLKKRYQLLAIPPDYTRQASLSGLVLQWLYVWWEAEVGTGSLTLTLLPALGRHRAMTKWELRAMFGELADKARVLVHKAGAARRVGMLSLPLLAELTAGRVSADVPVHVNPEFWQPYELVLSLGQVLPHEIFGMANYTKNLVIGLGGKELIAKTHFLGALMGMERLLAVPKNVLRAFIDRGYTEFLQPLHVVHFLHTVISAHSTADEQQSQSQSTPRSRLPVYAAYGTEADVFSWAAERSLQVNVATLAEPKQTIYAEFPAAGYTSTWIANKAVYRLRMALADGGRLVVIAPGLERFGEDAESDAFIERYGYSGRKRLLALWEHDAVEDEQLVLLAHLLHGSSDGRFKICYAVAAERLAHNRVRAVGYEVMTLTEARAEQRTAVDGAAGSFTVFNPALGFWRAHKQVKPS